MSKTRDVNGKQTSYWTGSGVSTIYNTAANPPEKPPAPKVEVTKYEMTAIVDNISDPRSDEIQFEVYDLTKPFNSGTVKVKPPAPKVEVTKYEMTAIVDNISDPRSDEIQFEVYDLTKPFNSGTVKVTACMASFKCKLNAGGDYRVRARSLHGFIQVQAQCRR